MNLYQKVRNISINFAMSLNDYPSDITFDEWAKENGKELMIELEDDKFNDPKLHTGFDSLTEKAIESAYPDPDDMEGDELLYLSKQSKNEPQSYKENVQWIAEEMATSSALKTGIPHFIPDYNEAARITVSKMKEYFVTGWVARFESMSAVEIKELHKQCIKRGLIPTQEGKKNER